MCSPYGILGLPLSDFLLVGA